MAPMTERALRASEWKRYYSYQGPRLTLEHFECVDFPNVLMIQGKWKGRKMDIYYLVDGRSTDSLASAARIARRKEQQGMKNAKTA